MTSLLSFPPSYNHSSKKISPSQALELLSSYLAESATNPSLHPNAFLTEAGPVTPTSGSSTGLTLHNLKRIEAGLRGEILATDFSLERQRSEQGENGFLRVTDSASIVDDEGKPPLDAGTEEVKWQDRGEYEREQEVSQGEIDERVAEGVKDGGKRKVPTVKETASTLDKEEQRAAERVKRKKEKRKLKKSTADRAAP